jgi:N6-L-threonylcarbamoyladenine synthase
MIILGIETSCDETAAAVLEDDERSTPSWRILSNVVASQAAIHREWGGVVPEIASRQHVRDICGVVEQALADASMSLDDLGAIAVTQGPGLVGSLLVGIAFAKSIAAARGLPLIPVHHLAGHIESLFLQHGDLPLPAAVLVVSGGHTSLYLVPTPGEYRLLGRTRDDAAGEAYDKVAKVIGLGYPGGPAIDHQARLGNDRAVALPSMRITHPDRRTPDDPGALDFSFSGLKTAVVRLVRARQAEHGGALTQAEIADLCASFQRVVVETLLDRTFDAARRHGAASIGIAGGVSANSRLREDALARGVREGVPVYIPALSLSTDNAAMIAAAGLRRWRQGTRAGLDLNADAALAL